MRPSIDADLLMAGTPCKALTGEKQVFNQAAPP